MNRAVNEVIRWIQFQVFNVRHGVSWRWQKLRGLAGDFEAPENSARAAQLTSVWERKWPDQEPLSYMTNGVAVRFHSLPGSKRYAESDSEYEEILRRQRTILDELRTEIDLSSLVIVAADWSASDLASGTSRRHLPNSWPWRIGHDRFDPEAPPVYFWAQLGIDGVGLDDLLRAGADNNGRFLFAEPDMTWLFCPYDGGVDVIFSTERDRDALERKYAEWLPNS